MKTFFFVPLLLCASINDTQAVELSELAKDSSREMYRFTWERSFNPKIEYTVDLSDPKKPTLAIRKFADEDSSKDRVEKAQLNEIQTKNLNRFLLAAQFWTLPSEGESVGMDGAGWRLEGIKDGSYHFTQRWSPLPPYFGWTTDGKDEKGNTRYKRTNPPMEAQVKHSDEVGLDMLCLYIILMADTEPEIIY